MKRTFFTLALLIGVIVTGFAQITDPFFEKVTYVGAFGKTDWTQGWANWNPQTTVYPATSVTVGDGSSLPTGTTTNVITSNTRWSSSNSPVVGTSLFTNSNLSDPFFEQVNYVGAFGTFDWTQGWANWDPQNTVYPATTVTINAGHITANTTWTSGNVYLLNGWVYVDAGVTLTIQPGTIIRGDKTNKAALIMDRGSKLIAQGTAAQPIVFTSNQGIGSRDRGDWGGLILCGYATVNQPGGTAVIEGGVGSIYGGGSTPNNADNSGVLKYVRVEFAGYPFAPDNEINGITFGGVGNGTSVDYVQVAYSNDDSYEWFGGTVNCKHLIAFRGMDDEFDTDNGFSGKLQFLVALRDPNVADVSGSNGFESDNDATGSSNLPITHPIFSNVSIFGPLVTLATPFNSNFKRAMHIRRNSTLCVYNSVFAGFPVGLYIDGNSTMANANSNTLQIENCIMSGMTTNFAVPSGQTWNATDEQNWYLAPSRHNSVLTNNTDLSLVDPFNLAGPNFTPAKTVYKLNGWLYVRNGATLTIDPGTIIRGDKTNKSALIIEQGAKLIANGTITEPIIFTSNENAGSRNRGDWGGVILCGLATVNLPGGTGVIEGGVGSVFGGGLTPNDADNSGSLKYVRLEFPGYAFQPNSEINGLTHGGVGSGTVEDYIQVSYSADDSYEWFGGTNNAKHLIAFRGQDDDFDTDNGFAGKLQFCVGMRENFADQSGSNGFESDNDASGSSNTPNTQATFSNFTVVGPMATLATPVEPNFKRAMHLRRNTQLKVHNCVFMGWPTGLYIDGNTTQANADANLLQVENTFMSGMTTNFDVPSGQTWSASTEQTWYQTPTRHNNTFTNNTDIQLVDAFNLTAPNFLPLATSPVWGASRWSRIVSGAVTYDNAASTPMNGTVVTLKTQGGAVVETATADLTGNFSIFAVDGVYVLDASSSKTWGGLGIQDVINTRKKISNLVTFTALQNKAADVNQTNTVNVQDPIVMRQKLSAPLTNWPNWKIANFVFEKPTVTVNGVNVIQNIKSLAGGDVNNSFVPAAN
ncbi:MAG: hypothetical protein ACOYNC_01215 [Bacteroidales bacterium]